MFLNKVNENSNKTIEYDTKQITILFPLLVLAYSIKAYNNLRRLCEIILYWFKAINGYSFVYVSPPSSAETDVVNKC